MPGSTPTADGSNLSDPFTGAGRYVPGAQPMDTSSTSTGADPFTGESVLSFTSSLHVICYYVASVLSP